MAIQTLHSPPAAERLRLPGGLVCSVAAHVILGAAVLWIASARPAETPPPQPREEPQRIVWIAMPGPSGGGGGSKAPVPTPPKPVPPPPAQAVARPAAPPPVPTEATVVEPEPLEPQRVIPAAISTLAMAGAAVTPAPAAGSGIGTGAGDGKGAGAGAGEDRGFGGGAYRPGNGVTPPVPVTRAPPRYTAAAMRARAHGVITVECVVEPSGECGDTRVVQAFAPPFGLDDEALAAARRWRFRPGMRGSEPVPVVVRLEIEFNIR